MTLDSGSFLVYVVDDSVISRKILTTSLNKIDSVVVKEFTNAIDASNSIVEKKPDLIITDMSMPEFDGLEFSFIVHKKYSDIPIFLVSADLNNDLIARALQNGVKETLKKPFKFCQLYQLMQHYIDNKNKSYEYNILVVDDDELFRVMLLKMLEPFNLRPYSAESTIEAMNILEKYEINIIILDNQLPGMQGVNFCKELKENDKFKSIPVIAVSAFQKSASEFLNSGADDFIMKNSITNEVCPRVKNMLYRVNLEKKLVEKIKNEKALNHQKNQLLGVAAHDMRSPLSFIISGLDVVKPAGNDPVSEHILSKVKNSANNMLNLLNDILNISSIESGQVKVEMQENSLKSCMRHTFDELSPIAENKNITMRFEYDDSTKDYMIKMDKSRIIQVLENLVSNAIKYSPENTEIVVKISGHVDAYLIQVVDQGQGIPENEIPGVFDEFKKTTVKATAGEGSTGLGLAIAKKLVGAHGGDIWVENNTGKGVTFSFTLPFLQ